MEAISQIKEKLDVSEEQALLSFVKEYEADERQGVKKLVKKAQKEYDALQKEKLRMEQMKQYERKYASCEYIA